jgi:hypothetical protein
MRRLLFAPLVSIVLVVVSVSAAYACGSLVGPNGAVNLVRTSTLAAWHDGVEHYVTNFEFKSDQTSFGSIIPLPAEPTKVERGGDWTLQRLQREVSPARRALTTGVAEAASPAGVEVLHQTRIDSLDVTILRGGGQAVTDWAAQQGFDLTPDTPDVLEFYAHRSPYFMAAKFDASAAVDQGLNSWDGIPVHLTIPVDRPWVPLRILATGKPATEPVQADVFLLTDAEPGLLAGPGLRLSRSQSWCSCRPQGSARGGGEDAAPQRFVADGDGAAERVLQGDDEREVERRHDGEHCEESDVCPAFARVQQRRHRDHQDADQHDEEEQRSGDRVRRRRVSVASRLRDVAQVRGRLTIERAGPDRGLR